MRYIGAASLLIVLSISMHAAPRSIEDVQLNVEKLEGKTIVIRGCTLPARGPETTTGLRSFLMQDGSGEEISVMTYGPRPATGECLRVEGVVVKLGGCRNGHSGCFTAFLRETKRQPAGRPPATAKVKRLSPKQNGKTLNLKQWISELSEFSAH